jgi:hypothetical protein
MTSINVMHDIWKRRLEIDNERRKKTEELMKQYDEEVYFPALKQLQEDCIKIYGEHEKTKYYNNGLGWEWWYCGRCGASHSRKQLF